MLGWVKGTTESARLCSLPIVFSNGSRTAAVGDGQQQRVGRGDCLVSFELLDQHIRFGNIAPTKIDRLVGSMKPTAS
jgi:hypothetical protein